MSKQTEQRYLQAVSEGHTVNKGEWKPKRGKPDRPEWWDRIQVRLTNGRHYTLSKEFVAENPLDWGLEE